MNYTKILTLLITLSIGSIYMVNGTESALNKEQSNEDVNNEIKNETEGTDAADYLKLSQEIMTEGDLIARKIEDTDTKSANSDTLLNAAFNNMLEGDKIERYQKSIEYANKALLIAQQKGEKSVEKKIYQQLSEIYEKIGNQEFANKYKQKSEEISDSTSSKTSALGKVKPLWYKRYGWVIVLVIIIICVLAAITIFKKKYDNENKEEKVIHKKHHKHTKRTKEEKPQEIKDIDNQTTTEQISHTEDDKDNNIVEETKMRIEDEQKIVEDKEQIIAEEDKQKTEEVHVEKNIEAAEPENLKADKGKKITEKAKTEDKKRTIIIKGKTNSFVELNPESIVYLKSDKNYITIYYLNNKRKIVSTEMYQSLSRALDTISTEERFFRCHRSYAVNMRYVTSWNEANVKTTCTPPIPSSKIFIDKFEEENKES